ncbi:hypothetical protein JCM6882_004080 [Rhodosporidiobolus microsporus]
MSADHSTTPSNHRRRTSAPPTPSNAASLQQLHHHRQLGSLINATPLNSPTVAPTALSYSQNTAHESSPRRASATALADGPPTSSTRAASEGNTASATDQSHDAPAQPLNLARLAPGVVPSRTGSVLSRGQILKSDYRFISSSRSSPSSPSSPSSSTNPSAPSTGAELNLSGATNLRHGGLGIWGLAQPNVTGIRSVLAVLRARGDKAREVAWFMTREEPVLYIGGQPYVLREASHPTRTYAISDRAENLEEIEARLKQDVLRESARYGGLILVHSETPTSPSPSLPSAPSPARTPTTVLQPTWISTDEVLTTRELFTFLRTPQGGSYLVSYHRTPVGRDQSPNDGYLDLYTRLLARVPTSTSLVFNCGAGVVRSTFAMCVAMVVRRRQLVDEGRADPFAPEEDPAGVGSVVSVSSPGGRGPDVEVRGAERVLRAQSEQARRDKSLLRLMHVLARSLPARSQGTILPLLSSQANLLENLRSALLGSYDLLLSLLSILDHGPSTKSTVDAIIDSADAMVNLRESILIHRVRYASHALTDQATAADQRAAALAALERYFFLVAFAAFVEDSPPTSTNGSNAQPVLTFSAWLKRRTEIAKMISRLRKTGREAAASASSTEGFYVFSPVHDLSAIAKGGDGGEGAGAGERGAAKGGAVGEEWVGQIVRNRSGIILRTGMILKDDRWLTLAEGQEESRAVRGAINFRRVPGEASLWGLSQPTEEGVRRVLETVKADLKPGGQVVWIGVREEPLTNINGTPYVLRQQAVSLRNVKSYSGISSARLELLESRLKSDVLSELRTFEGRILVATETDDGSVHPVWETVASDAEGQGEGEGEEGWETQVKTLREVMDQVGKEVCGERFRFIRVPITAEASPDFHDLREIIETVSSLDLNESAIIVNDQLGRGRTTRTLVIIRILQDWLRNNGKFTAPPSERQSYTVINNLLRVVRNGFEVKNAVDAAITACGEPFDLLESIENARQQAEDSEEGAVRDKWIARGVRELRAYFFLIVFMSFLNESRPTTRDEIGRSASYEDFVRSRPVFRTIEKELDVAAMETLLPLQRNLHSVTSGTASNDEVQDFVAKRDGRILSAYTMLKSDFFSGLQKMSLPERVDGAPNFRRVPLSLAGSDLARTPASASLSSVPSSASLGPALSLGVSATTTQKPSEVGPLVYGSGMPTVDGLRRLFERIGARETRVLWSSLREEPVLYVAGRPHVLRLFNQPLENVITTGVKAATVEAQEEELKRDLLRERERTDGQVLLHDEIEEDGNFTVTAMWEEVGENDILTPREVFRMMQSEGFKVDYDRLPVTDEQAPIPGIFSRIEQRVSSALVTRKEGDAGGEGIEKVSFGWNCQMGRGRTTTGMVACALVHRILFSPSNGSRGTNPDLAASFLLPAPTSDEPPHSLHWDGREAEPFLAGEYKIVLQLVGVLGQGKVAKRLTDRAIDDMEAVQNLRTAVHGFKMRFEAAEEGTRKKEKIFDQALNYLYRYATLIVFANFLLDKASHLASFSSTASSASSVVSADDTEDEGDAAAAQEAGKAGFPSFEEYLRERTEIRKILSRRTLE